MRTALTVVPNIFVVETVPEEPPKFLCLPHRVRELEQIFAEFTAISEYLKFCVMNSRFKKELVTNFSKYVLVISRLQRKCVKNYYHV